MGIPTETVAADRSSSPCAMKELKTRVGPLVGPGKPLSSRSFERAAKAYKQTSRSTKNTTALDKKLSLSEIAATKKLGELASHSYKLEKAERKTNFDEPGWKIERKYDNSVKIGNWFEERRSYNKIIEKHATTISRSDYVAFNPKPNPQIRWMAAKREQGLPKQFLHRHHGDLYEDSGLISGYDQEYNRTAEQPKRTLRKWDQHKIKWAPERTDFPMRGKGTKFGLVEVKQARDQRDNEESERVLASTFAASYSGQTGTRDVVFAVPRDLSSKVEPISRLNKNLKLRNSPVSLVPDSYTNIQLLESNLAKAKEMLKHSHI